MAAAVTSTYTCLVRHGHEETDMNSSVELPQ